MSAKHFYSLSLNKILDFESKVCQASWISVTPINLYLIISFQDISTFLFFNLVLSWHHKTDLIKESKKSWLPFNFRRVVLAVWLNFQIIMALIDHLYQGDQIKQNFTLSPYSKKMFLQSVTLIMSLKSRLRNDISKGVASGTNYFLSRV